MKRYLLFLLMLIQMIFGVITLVMVLTHEPCNEINLPFIFVSNGLSLLAGSFYAYWQFLKEGGER